MIGEAHRHGRRCMGLGHSSKRIMLIVQGSIGPDGGTNGVRLIDRLSNAPVRAPGGCALRALRCRLSLRPPPPPEGRRHPAQPAGWGQVLPL